MDVNVCSRRVHDGYATIRSRGRPRAVYRSDSEELLKETDGPYALPRLSNFPVVSEDARQVPRWADLGRDQPLIENYGTLRVVRSRDLEEPQKVTLKTFSRRDKLGTASRNDAAQSDLQYLKENNGENCEVQKKDELQTSDVDLCNHYGWKCGGCARYDCDQRVYDTVPLEDDSKIRFFYTGKTSLENDFANIDNNQRDVCKKSREDVENLNNCFTKVSKNNYIFKNHSDSHVEVENDKLTSVKDEENVKNEIIKSSKTSIFKNDLENAKRGFSKNRQPIYAIPQVFSKPRRERQLVIVDGNYVPSGDLYRTTVKYIEDINRNLAEIDKSYEEMKASPRTYGVINRIAKNQQDQSSNLFGYVRKRDMAPMLPISADIDEVIEEKNEKESGKDARYLRRPNSKGRLPPKILPRSSSIENTSRHSTGSTTASSSKSTESLYAISESLTELPKISDLQKQDSTWNKISQESRRSDLHNQSKSNIDRDISKRIKPEGSKSKDSSSSTDDEVSMSKNRLPVTNAIRRNRSRVDQAEKPLLRKERASNEILGRISGKLEQVQSLENRLKDRRYDTLPSRKPRTSSRSLHKSSEDVLDGERISRKDSSLQRSCSSNNDVRRKQSADEDPAETRRNPFYMMDATEVILKGLLERSNSLQQQDCFPKARHNSLNCKEPDGKVQSVGGFATLPRRGNLVKDQSEPPRRFSGNGSILEPLYEHAVSDPVKPRETQNVIPWWELATRKYRHRSCPSLQAHVVSAFEQSLSNMTQRLQQLTATAEKKDSELQELRETIERLRKQSAEAGLNNGPAANNGRRHTLGDSESGTTGCTGSSSNSNNHHQGASMARQLSADSVTSLNSLSSACSASSNHHKKKGWLRSSFSKAFSRSRKNRHGSVSDAEDCKESPGGDLSAPNSPRLPTASKHESSRGQAARSNGQKSPDHENPLSGSKSSSALYKKEDEDVDELKKQLREKDLVLTDIRLEALSSAHQLESLKDTVIKMRYEMLNLKQNNERLQRLVTSKSLTSSQSSLPSDPDRRFSMTEVASSVAALSNGDASSTADQLEDLNVPVEHDVVPSSATTSEPVLEQDTDGKRINVAVYLGSERNFNYNLVTGSGSTDGTIGEPPHCVIASVCISNKTSWDALDSMVRRCFKEYVSRVDPVTNLGLGVECVAAYHLGEASRCTTDSQHPELLPCGYLVGHVKTIYLVLSGYSWLAVDTLIPRSIVQRLISLLTEHRRVILCGPSGTGKSYLAGKLAHALVDTDNDTKDAAAVATFNVDHKSSKELRQYLAHIAERCDSSAADELPRVIILENLQHAASLGELFSGLLGTRHSSCPAIIGTMSQATCSTTNLQLHHNFRWVLCANHMEPVKGFLGRYLRRKLLEHELRECAGTRNAEMAAVVEWLPRVWLHLNKFLETHSSSDVTIGPRLFLSCPMEVAGSQVWFTDLWNYSVIPYLVEAVREGLTLYGRRVSGNGNGEPTWEDPAQFITSSYPWLSTHAVHGGSDALLRLRPEDVGYDVVSSGHTSGVGASSVKSLGSTHSDTEGDPLVSILNIDIREL
ncbi:protein sickie-like protein [Lasius niger]|uniref:Protein sickie-like protein n=1 Tax=Lasius niger TaxID=67767 RepID=A0A0J7LAV6_LASNI|nr:protein sickie-like protein [Lasius niger]